MLLRDTSFWYQAQIFEKKFQFPLSFEGAFGSSSLPTIVAAAYSCMGFRHHGAWDCSCASASTIFTLPTRSPPSHQLGDAPALPRDEPPLRPDYRRAVCGLRAANFSWDRQPTWPAAAAASTSAKNKERSATDQSPAPNSICLPSCFFASLVLLQGKAHAAREI